MRHQNVPASYLILFENNKTLLLKRFNTGYEDGNYSLIAGHVEKGESFTNAIIREAYEEANIKLEAENLKVVHIMHRKSIDSERVDVFFTADKWEGEVKNKEQHKCLDLAWFELNRIPENTVLYIKDAIYKTKNNIFYSEYGWK